MLINLQAVLCNMDKVLYWRVKQEGKWFYKKVVVSSEEEYADLVGVVMELRP